MRICVDLDGTIAENKKGSESYEAVLPKMGASESLQRLKNKGFYIIIHTARNMGTHKNNLGKVIASQAGLVSDWLERHQIPYDELLFGKPNVDFFIDDKGLTFTNWPNIESFLMSRQTNTNV
tara:strand:- start:2300 stop:2665 length:366 start_codon:yes stop_codon:yes gene_type:complete